MLISFTTMVSENTEPTWTPTLRLPTCIAEGALNPGGLPTKNPDNSPLPENGEIFAAPRRTSTLVICEPPASTPFLTIVLSEKKTTASAATTSTTSPTPIQRIIFFIGLATSCAYAG